MISKTKATATREEARPALVPKLRFPEFRRAEEWKPITLEEASTPVAERVGDRKLTPVSISAGIGFVPQAEKFGRDISGNQYRVYTLVRDGDFVFNKGNSLKFPQGCVYLLQGWGQVAAPNVFICFRLKDGYSNGFFQQCFEQNQHGRQLKRHITSGARSNGLLNISKETFFGVEIPTPSLAEQQKIAECLSSVDELMAAQARKVDALKTHKKGLMQQLFPREGETQPRLRFPEFQSAGEWEDQSIGDFGKVVTGSTPRTAQPTFYGGGIPLVSPADISDERFVDQTKTTLTTDGFAETRQIRAGSVLFVSIGSTIGKVAQNVHDCATNQQINAVVPSSKHSDGFVYFALSFASERIALLAGRQAVPIINKRLFSAVRVLAPKLPEQQRIASCLSSLDALITAETQKLEALKTHKKGLMQQLFPSPEEVDA
jgi:type I restriction enzyme, S subunit